jgi:hypothetical protein
MSKVCFNVDDEFAVKSEVLNYDIVAVTDTRDCN